MNKKLYFMIVAALVVVFLVSTFFVVNYVINSREQASKYEDLANQLEQFDTPATVPTTGEVQVDDATLPQQMLPAEEPVDPETGILMRYLDFYKQNPDMVGWIKIAGTNVNYPVMQTPHHKDYYLERDFEREDSAWGAIYVREECDVFEPSDNVTIYGHTMKDGSMFANLHEYTDKAFWEQNNAIFFDTLYERHVYQIFAVFTTTATLNKGFSYHRMEYAKDEADFDKFIATCKDLALYETGITPVYGEKIICLSTCEYSQEHGRLVVAAVRIY